MHYTNPLPLPPKTDKFHNNLLKGMHYTNPLPLPPKTDKFHNNFLKEMHTTNPLPLLYNIQDNIKNINHNMCKNKINN